MTGRAVVGWTVAAAYVAATTGLATVGFESDATWAILLAAAIALPSSVPGVVGFYVAYGLLALVPGANPDESSGGGSCTAAGCTSWSTGDLATWFELTTDAVGVIVLTAAAIANVLLWRAGITRLRRAPSGSAAGGASSPGRPRRGGGTTPRRPGPAAR